MGRRYDSRGCSQRFPRLAPCRQQTRTERERGHLRLLTIGRFPLSLAPCPHGSQVLPNKPEPVIHYPKDGLRPIEIQETAFSNGRFGLLEIEVNFLFYFGLFAASGLYGHFGWKQSRCALVSAVFLRAMALR